MERTAVEAFWELARYHAKLNSRRRATEVAAHDRGFRPDMPVVLDRFKVI